MTNYFVLSKECLEKLSHCFSNTEEISDFISHMETSADEIAFHAKLRQRMQTIDEKATILMRQVAILTIFCREHYDLIRELVNKLEPESVTKEKFEEICGDELDI